MSTIVPTTPSGESHWIQRTALGGRDYQLEFDWNQRTGHWTLAIGDQDGSPITVVTLVTEWPLLRRVIDSRRPTGELVVVDSAGAGAEPTFSGLGDRFQLLYFAPEELEA
jgi:hypothetical protein